MKKLKSLGLLTMVLALLIMAITGCYSSNTGSSTTPGSSPSGGSPSGGDDTPKTPAKWIGNNWTGSSNLTDANSFVTEFTANDDMITNCKIAEGAFNFNTVGISSGTNFSAPASFFTAFATTSELTIIVRLRAEATSTYAAVDFDLSYAQLRQRVQFTKNNTIQLYNGTSSSSKYTGDFSSYHTYMITYSYTGSAIETAVYIDGSTTAAVSASSAYGSSSNSFRISDGSGSTEYNSDLDWFYYTTDGAFTPNNVVLQTGISL
jgi:hypothetical protein